MFKKRYGLHLLRLLVLHWVVCQGSNNLSGPLEDKNFSVPEGRFEVRYIYQFKPGPPVASLRLTGETDGVLWIDQTEGILYLNGSLDWETKKVHKLQLEGLNANGERVKGPYSIMIIVEDINDNQPQFDQPEYYGVVRQRSRPGKPFMHVTAFDRDDPSTPNAQLRYSILHHFPNPYNEMLFQINDITGDISPTLAGSKYLDPAVHEEFLLVVAVKDMAGLSVNSFTSNANVNIKVMENLWKDPPTVHIKENSTAPHPMSITQVQWNDPGVKYEIYEREKQSVKLPFTVDQNGTIYVTEPLDREEKDTYSFSVAVRDNEGSSLAIPVRVTVVVEDINDNPPVCQKAVTKFEVQENEGVGNYIGTLKASDRDQKDTHNSWLQYYLIDQNPKVPAEKMFIVQPETGAFQLISSALNKKVASNYTVMVEVKDPVFKTQCEVRIFVIDINDKIPIFEKSDYGSLTLPEDTPLGTVILEVQATDADEPLTGSSQIKYIINKGDPDNTFSIRSDRQTNRGYLTINKVLDFETAPTYILTINATNPEPLVAGVEYNASSVAYFRLNVTDVNEAPVFLSVPYIVDLHENATINTLVKQVTAFDPEGDQIKFMLRNDYRKWLRIDPLSGEIRTAALLDRETQNSYVVQIVATEQTKESRSSTTELILNLKDVNDNPPKLDKDYLFFCHPLQGSESAQIEVSDPDQYSFVSMFSYSLMGGPEVQDNWDVSKPGNKYAYIAPKNRNLEEKIYHIPLKINDNGKPPMEGDVTLQVNVCQCTAEKLCRIKTDPTSNFPTVGMAIGTLAAVLVVIGVILACVFLHLKRKKQKEQKVPAESAVNSAELTTLT